MYLLVRPLKRDQPFIIIVIMSMIQVMMKPNKISIAPVHQMTTEKIIPNKNKSKHKKRKFI